MKFPSSLHKGIYANSIPLSSARHEYPTPFFERLQRPALNWRINFGRKVETEAKESEPRCVRKSVAGVTGGVEVKSSF